MQTIYSGGFILLFLCPLLLAGDSNPLSGVYSICIRKMQSHWIPGHGHTTALHRYRNQKNRQQREGEIPPLLPSAPYIRNNWMHFNNVIHNSWYRSSSNLPLMIAYLTKSGLYISSKAMTANSLPAFACKSISLKFIFHHLYLSFNLLYRPVINR